MGLLKQADKYSPEKLEKACEMALQYTQCPSYKSITNILATMKNEVMDTEETTTTQNKNGITRGAGYYRRTRS